MEPGRRWCDRKACPDYGIAGAGNIKVFSYVEQRYYCATCRHTFARISIRSSRPCEARARRYSKRWHPKQRAA